MYSLICAHEKKWSKYRLEETCCNYLRDTLSRTIDHMDTKINREKCLYHPQRDSLSSRFLPIFKPQQNADTAGRSEEILFAVQGL